MKREVTGSDAQAGATAEFERQRQRRTVNPTQDYTHRHMYVDTL